MEKLRWPARYNEVPNEALVRSDLFEEELKRIFYGPEWHPVAHVGELPQVGDFKTYSVGRVPLLIVHGEDGQYHAFLNACTHRSTQLETTGRGNRKEFECPYHRWLFNSTGDLIGCPNEREYSPGFQRSDYALHAVRTAIFKGLIFVTLSNDTPSLEGWLEEVAPVLAEILLGDGRLKLLGYQKVRYKASWKVYNDNDGWHAPLLHRAFRMLNWQGGAGKQIVTRSRGHFGFLSELTHPTQTDLLKDPTILTFKGTDPSKGSRVVELFPAFVATKHLDMVSLRFANPVSHDETEVHYTYFGHEDDDEEMTRHRVRQSSNLLGPIGMISMEDASIFHRAYIGSHVPGKSIFQKGVKYLYQLDYDDLKQNDETGNLVKWEYYRKVMGFERGEG